MQDLHTQEKYIAGPTLRRDFNNRHFFGQASGLVKKGTSRRVNEEDIWRLDEENTARGLWDSFEPIWNDEQKKTK
jgi:hypothetical protein